MTKPANPAPQGRPPKKTGVPCTLLPLAAVSCTQTDPELSEKLWSAFDSVADSYMGRYGAAETMRKINNAIKSDPEAIPEFVHDTRALRAFAAIAAMAQLRSFAFVHPERTLDCSAVVVDEEKAEKVPYIKISRNRTIRLLPSVCKLAKADEDFVRMLTESQPTVRFDFSGRFPRLVVSLPFGADEIFANSFDVAKTGSCPASIVAYRRLGGAVRKEQLCTCTLKTEGTNLAIETDSNGPMLLSAASVNETVVRVVPEYGYSDLGVVFKVPALSGENASRPAWCPAGRLINPAESKRWDRITADVELETVVEATRRFWWFGSGLEFIAKDLARARPKLLAKDKKPHPE